MKAAFDRTFPARFPSASLRRINNGLLPLAPVRRSTAHVSHPPAEVQRDSGATQVFVLSAGS